jgi:hypothetical protein
MSKAEDNGHQASVHRPEGEVLSLLPLGLLQTVASVKHCYWYSRSDEFLGQGLMQNPALAPDAGGHVVRDRLCGLRLRLGFGYSLKDKGLETTIEVSLLQFPPTGWV